METMCSFEPGVNISGSQAGERIVEISAVQSLMPWGKKGDGGSCSICSQTKKSLLLLFLLTAVLGLCCVDVSGECLAFSLLTEQGGFGARSL